MPKRKEPLYLKRRLDAIYRKGDYPDDEAILKHIAHSMTCLVLGRNWNEQIDYNCFNEYQIIAEKWENLQALRDEVGLERFREEYLACPYGIFFEGTRIYYERPRQK